MANIFVSYNRGSGAVAKTLTDDIKELGHTAWFDQELSGGQVWWDKILATIRNCDIFVFVLDPAALNSTACKRESAYAQDLGKPILPVLVSEGVSTNLLPPALSQIQFVDYRKQDRSAVIRLARAIAAIPPPGPLPDPLPSPPEVPISYLGSLTEQVETTSALNQAQQSVLVIELKRALRDSGTREDARILLERLRKRRDLYASIAEEIEELLGPRAKVEATPATPLQAPEDAKPVAADRNAEDDFKTGEACFAKENYAEAVKWYRMAADQGHAEAQYALGYSYQYGHGVDPDDEEAATWYRMAAEQGHEAARQELQDLELSGAEKAAQQTPPVVPAFSDEQSKPTPVETAAIEPAPGWKSIVKSMSVAALIGGSLLVAYNTVIEPWLDREETRTARYTPAVPSKAAKETAPAPVTASAPAPAPSPAPSPAPADQKQAASTQDMVNAYKTGESYSRQKNYTEAVQWYRKAAEQGYAPAQDKLGLMYEEGRGVTRNYPEALKWYRKAVEQANASAQANLGSMYANARGVARDDAEAVRWFRMAANQGDPNGQDWLGTMYLEGRGVARNDVEAVKWYRKSAEQGFAVGQANLGVMYAQGRGIARNDAEAVRWLRKAAEQGHDDGQYHLGVMYAAGQGVTKSDAEAVKWFRKAAEQGHESGQYYLGVMYAQGRGIARSDAEAVNWFRKAAEQGNLDGQYSMGVMYEKGRGVPKSDAEAARWYRMAAEGGDADAQNQLGVMYREGRGVAQSDAEAVKWFRKSADQGGVAAQSWLGLMYEKGLGVPKNDAEAVNWYRKAARAGSKYSQEQLKRKGLNW